jgi:hypothetical protein
MNAVVRSEQTTSTAVAVLDLISRAATDPACDIDKMERLLQMQERILDRNAKAAYADALARLQPKLPLIAERGGIKDKHGNVQSRYALWEDVVHTITPILAEEGFSLSFRTRSDEKSVTVTGVLLHREGHSEQTDLTLPMDVSGSKNNVQGVGSSTSYGKRYTAAALLNLRTGGEDDDGAGGSKEPLLSESQIADMNALLSEVGANKVAFLKWCKVGSLSEIYAKNFDLLCREIRAKKSR